MTKVLKKAIERALTKAQIIDVKYYDDEILYIYDTNEDEVADYEETYCSGQLVATWDVQTGEREIG